MLTVETVDRSDHPYVAQVRDLFKEYAKELGVDLCFQGFESELNELPGKYSPPNGLLVVAIDGDQVVGCGAMRPLDATTCELKRIYVCPSHRGRGIGRYLTDDLIARSDELGYAVVRLDTLRRLTSALALYRSLGFQEIEPYNFNPEPDVAYFERQL